MARKKRPRSGKAANESETASLALNADDMIVEAREAIEDGLLDYFDARQQIFAEKGLAAADFSDGLRTPSVAGAS